MFLINLLKLLDKFLARVTVRAVGLYQIFLSPDHGLLRDCYPYGFCRYYPSCSQYAKDSILNRGFALGAPLAAWRILRCNPWAKPKIDDLRF